MTPGSVRRADVAVEGDAIVELAPDLRGPAREEIDATGLHVFPGLIDAHVHFNEPGRTDWEGFATGSAALAAGGGTCFFDMPLNAHPPTLDAKSFKLKLRAAEASSSVDFALWGGLTPQNLKQMEELADSGVVGFKAFMSNSGIDDFARADDDTLWLGMMKAARLGLPVAVHAESEEMTSKRTASTRERGGRSWRDYLSSRPPIAEIEATQRAITFAADRGCKLHIVHVTHPHCAELVAIAREHGVDVTCETCPHYLSFSDVDLHRLGAVLKCAPPLRSDQDVDALWAGINDGKFAFVASDHSPAPESMKDTDDAFTVWGGIAGVQSTLAVLLSRDPSLAPPLVARLTAGGVADRFAIAKKGRLALGFDADLSLVDLSAKYELTRAMLLDRHGLSPYVGRTFRGLVRRTIARGRTVFLDGRIVGNHRGRLVKPQRGPAHA